MNVTLKVNITLARGGAHLPIAHAVHPGITIWVDEIELEKKIKIKKKWGKGPPPQKKLFQKIIFSQIQFRQPKS